MMNIRQQQFEDIKENKYQAFVVKAKQFLQKNYPERTNQLDEKKLGAIVESSILRAESYKIVTEQGIISFLELMFSISFDFDSNERTNWTRKILNEHQLTEPEKIMKIINTLNKF